MKLIKETSKLHISYPLWGNPLFDGGFLFKGPTMLNLGRIYGKVEGAYQLLSSQRDNGRVIESSPDSPGHTRAVDLSDKPLMQMTAQSLQATEIICWNNGNV